MDYKTIYETPEQNQVILLKNIFEHNNVRYKFLDESTNNNFPVGVRVQVHQNDVKRAEGLLLENGFLKDTGKEPVSASRFWLWFVVALICLIVAAFLINMLMQG